MAKIDGIDIPSLIFQEAAAPSTPASTKWKLYAKTTGLFYKDDAGVETGPLAGAGGAGGISLVRNTAQRDSTSTSFADVTGMTFSVVAGATYRFRFVVFFFTAVNTTALRLAVNGPAMTSIRYGGFIPTAAASNSITVANGQISAVDNSIVSTSSGPGGSGVMAIVEGVCQPSSSGTLALRFASEVGGSTVSIEANSYGELIQF